MSNKNSQVGEVEWEKLLGREKNMNKASELSKCMEGLMKSQICFISSDRDSGFREQPTAVDIMYLDFSRAFVQAYHDITVDKMEKYGLNNRTIKWINNS